MFEKVIMVRESVSRLTRAVNYRIGIVNAVIDCLKAGTVLDDDLQAALIVRAKARESFGFSPADFSAAADYCTKGAEYHGRNIVAYTETAILAARAYGRVKAKLAQNGGAGGQTSAARRDAERAHEQVETAKAFRAAFLRAVSLFQAAGACVA
jgi:hypothetical protein